MFTIFILYIAIIIFYTFLFLLGMGLTCFSSRIILVTVQLHTCIPILKVQSSVMGVSEKNVIFHLKINILKNANHKHKRNSLEILLLAKFPKDFQMRYHAFSETPVTYFKHSVVHMFLNVHVLMGTTGAFIIEVYPPRKWRSEKLQTSLPLSKLSMHPILQSRSS